MDIIRRHDFHLRLDPVELRSSLTARAEVSLVDRYSYRTSVFRGFYATVRRSHQKGSAKQ